MALEDQIKCREVENTTLHPIDCCKYPRFYDNPPYLLARCNSECRMLPYPTFRCIRICIIENYQVLTRSNGGMVKNENRISFAFFAQTDVEGNNCSLCGSKPLPLEWQPIVIKNANYCLSEFPLFPGSNTSRNVSEDERFEYYYTNYVECIRLQNFLACTVNKTDECDKMKAALMYCKTVDYSFLHKFFFEDFYYKNKTEEVRLRKRIDAGVTEADGDVTGDTDSEGSATRNIETTNLNAKMTQNVEDLASTKDVIRVESTESPIDNSKTTNSTESNRSN